MLESKDSIILIHSIPIIPYLDEALASRQYRDVDGPAMGIYRVFQ
jgi:hypothetical protein